MIDITNPDPEQRYAYYAVVGRQTPKILRVRLPDLSEQGVETVENMKSLRYGTIDTARHYAYFTSFAGNIPHIAKLNIAKFHDGGSDSTVYNMESTKAGDGILRDGFDYPWFDEGLVIDTAHNYAYTGHTIQLPVLNWIAGRTIRRWWCA